MKIIYVFILAMTMMACTSKTENDTTAPVVVATPPLFINTIMTIEGDRTNDSISTVTDPYFEATLSSSAADSTKTFFAKKDIQRPVGDRIVRSTTYYVSDQAGQTLRFNNSTEFLKFMSNRGYGLMNEVKNKTGTDYRFKKN